MTVLRERRVRPQGHEGAARRERRERVAEALGHGPARGLRAAASPASCRAASGSGSRSPGRWSTGRGCCCSTSRSARSTSSSASRCRSSSRQIQREVGITFVFVTHDQEEALTMSDRIAVFNRGRIEQVGTPGRGLRAARDRRSSPASSARRTCCTPSAAEALLGRARAVQRPAGEDPRSLAAGEPGRRGRAPSPRHASRRSSTSGRDTRVSSSRLDAGGDARRPAAEPARRRRRTSLACAGARSGSSGTASTRPGPATTLSPAGPTRTDSRDPEPTRPVRTDGERCETHDPRARSRRRAPCSPLAARGGCGGRRATRARARPSSAGRAHGGTPSARARASSTSSPGPATPRTAPTDQGRRLGDAVREGHRLHRSTSRSATRPTRWSP